MKTLVITLLLTIATDAEFKTAIVWSFLKISSADVINYQPDILNIVLVPNVGSTATDGLTGILDVKKDLDDKFKVCVTHSLETFINDSLKPTVGGDILEWRI